MKESFYFGNETIDYIINMMEEFICYYIPIMTANKDVFSFDYCLEDGVTMEEFSYLVRKGVGVNIGGMP